MNPLVIKPEALITTPMLGSHWRNLKSKEAARLNVLIAIQWETAVPPQLYIWVWIK